MFWGTRLGLFQSLEAPGHRVPIAWSCPGGMNMGWAFHREEVDRGGRAAGLSV